MYAAVFIGLIDLRSFLISSPVICAASITMVFYFSDALKCNIFRKAGKKFSENIQKQEFTMNVFWGDYELLPVYIFCCKCGLK
jgi:hypothetical protein